MKIHLYLIPYAGADISCFASLTEKIREAFAEQVVITPVELRGHGKRRKEPLYEDMDDAVSDVMKQIDSRNEPVILYGHCIGGIIAYAVYRKCMAFGVPDIRSVILGSSIINRADADGFGSYLNSYVEENIRMMFPQLPDNMLRQLAEYKRTIVDQEFQVVREYLMHNPVVTDEHQLLVFGSEDKLVDPERISEDYEELDGVKKLVIPGGHFFLEESSAEIVSIIGEKIREIQASLLAES